MERNMEKTNEIPNSFYFRKCRRRQDDKISNILSIGATSRYLI